MNICDFTLAKVWINTHWPCWPV